MILINVSTYSTLQKITEELSLRTGLFLAVFAIDIILKFHLAAWFILVHVVYYNVAHRIAALASVIRQHESGVERVGRAFHLLATASNRLESIFSLPVFLVITTSFFSCTVNLFLLIQELILSGGEFVSQSVCLHFTMVATFVLFPLVIILSVDLPNKEVLLLLPMTHHYVIHYSMRITTGETTPARGDAIFQRTTSQRHYPSN